MRLFFYITLILTLSSCNIFKGTMKSDPLIVVDSVEEFAEEWPDTDGDGITDDKDNCPFTPGTIGTQGCPEEKPHLVMANLVSYDAPDHFIHSLDEIENEDLKNYFKELGSSIQDINIEILNGMANRGIISGEEYNKLLLQIEEGEVPNLPSNVKSPYIPDIENMNIVDKTSEDTTSSKGTIAYSVPSEMVVGNKYPIKVRITKEKGKEINRTLVLGDREIPISDVTLDSKITIENIRVERTMTAQLLSEDGAFEISAMNTDKQVVEDEGYTEWSWVVVPLKSGTSYLKMIIKIKVVSGEETYYKDIVVFDKNIQVKANVSLGVKSWISQYWQWLMTTIIIPLAIFFYKKRKEKKEK